MLLVDVKNRAANFLKNEKSLFLIVGGYNTAFGFLLLNALMLVFSDDYVILVLIATYPIQLVHNFFTFEKIVFRANIGIIKGLIKLNNSYMIIAAFNFAAISFLVYVLGLNDNLAYNIVFPILLIGQYLLHKKYTFR